MSRWIDFGKGSKRRIRQIRWKRSEIIYMAFLAVSIAIFCAIFTLWIAGHPFE